MSKAMIDANCPSPDAWLGHLAGMIGHFLRGTFDEKDLRQSYSAFRDSPCVDDELRDLLPDPKEKR